MLESRRPHDVVGAGRPREIVDVLLIVAIGRGAVGVLVSFDLDAGRAERPTAGNGQRDVVDAEVGEELRARVELMAVPAAILQDAELREPLDDEEEVADGAGARERARHVGGPFDLDRGGRSRRDRLRRLAPSSPSGRPGCRRPAR